MANLSVLARPHRADEQQRVRPADALHWRRETARAIPWAQWRSLHYMNYNFARPHATLTKDAGGYKVTPAMAAGVERRVWTHRDIGALLD